MIALKLPVVISIAGLDPSAGAGLLADIKTIEANGAHAMGVCTSLTFQNDEKFEGLNWVSASVIIRQLKPLLERYPCKVFKFGIIESLTVLNEVIDYILSVDKDAFIIWDPVLKSSTGFNFHEEVNKEELLKILKKASLITPNIPELQYLQTGADITESSIELSKYCAVYLKGGHDLSKEFIEDRLFYNGKVESFLKPTINKGTKHGSGCVLSSSIAANYARNKDLYEACKSANSYIEKYLSSSNHLVGYHHYEKA